MAIRLDEIYARFYRRSFIAFIAVEIIIASGSFALFAWLDDFIPLPLATAAAGILFAFLEIIFGIIFVKRVLEPADVLSRVIVQVSDQKTTRQAPFLNQKRLEKNGVKNLAQVIYDLRERSTTPNESASDHDTKRALDILTGLPIGIVALDANRNVIWNNGLAPVYTDARGEKHLKLMWNSDTSDSLDSWLDDVELTALSAERIWTRVPNVPAGDDDRMIFDVLVEYNKNAPSGVETMLLAIDRTATYAADEETMDFIALAAHELRAPITVIRGYLDELSHDLGSQLNDEQKQLINRLFVSSNRLTNYINNILNASRYDHRHLKLTLTETSVRDILDTVSDDLSLRAATLGQIIAFDAPDDLPTVAADPGSVSEVISNLVDNAIKYSHEGGHIAVTARVDGDFVEISVIDHGIGIPSAVMGHLFDKFYRSHRSRSTVTGTGLGLYISRAIIESHGGTIGVKSTEGEGSTFSFTLPIYATVADKIRNDDNDNSALLKKGGSWIRNHSMTKG